LWSRATLPIVYFYWLYWSYIITDYSEGILFNKIVIMCYFTYGIFLLIILMVYLLILSLIILRESCFIRLWSRATLLIVYCYWLYWWYITDYTEGILFNKIVIMCYFTYGVLLLMMLIVYSLILLLIILRESCFIRLWSRAMLYIVYIVTDCMDGILLLIILRESC